MEENKAGLRQLLEEYKAEAPLPQERLVELLREIQKLYGCIPETARAAVCEELGVAPSVTATLIRLYPSLRQAVSRHKVTVCGGPRCASKGAAGLLEAVKKELKTEAGSVSKEGGFLLTVQNCMKKCKSGPNLIIDGDLYSFVKPSDVPRLLAKYRDEAGTAGDGGPED